MNKTLEILKSIYKPYKYTIKGKATILETMTGEYIIKEKDKDLKDLYNYLESRGFIFFPSLIDASRSDVNVFEYVTDSKRPEPQKLDDLMDTIASLHNKTSYFKEVSEDHFKKIYEDVKSNLLYQDNYYNTLFDIHINDIYMSPSVYLFMRNYYLIKNNIDYAYKLLDEWYDLVKSEKNVRVCIVHNNLSLDHYLSDKLISWDHYLVDTPVLDIYKLYQNTWDNIDFKEPLEKYFYKFPFIDYEKKLLYILMLMPPQPKKEDTEFKKCKELNKVINYIYKSKELVWPDNSNHEEKE